MLVDVQDPPLDESMAVSALDRGTELAGAGRRQLPEDVHDARLCRSSRWCRSVWSFALVFGCVCEDSILGRRDFGNGDLIDILDRGVA